MNKFRPDLQVSASVEQSPTYNLRGLFLHLDASKTDSIILNSGNNSVVEWRDISNSNVRVERLRYPNNLSQHTSASMPIYSASVAILNNNPGIYFDRDDPSLLSLWKPGWGSLVTEGNSNIYNSVENSAFEVFLVDGTGDGAGGRILDNSNAAPLFHFTPTRSGANLGFAAQVLGQDFVEYDDNYNANEIQLFGLSYDGSTASGYYQSPTAVATNSSIEEQAPIFYSSNPRLFGLGSVAGGNPDVYQLGSAIDPQSGCSTTWTSMGSCAGFTGYVCELLHFDRALTASERASLYDALETKWGPWG